MKRKLMLLLVVLLFALPILVSADTYVHINTVYVQNPGPNYGGPAGSWWDETPTQIAEAIRDYGCAITCVGMVVSDYSSNYGASHPYGVFLTNSRYFGDDNTLVQKTSAQWDDLARDYGLPAPLPGVISLAGYSAVSKAYTLEYYLSQGYYPIVKLLVPGAGAGHWVLFYGSGSVGQMSSEEHDLLEQLRREGGELIPFVYDHPEAYASGPLDIMQETTDICDDKQTAYDDLFMIHDPNKSAGPYINFTQNSKGATLEHCIAVKLMRR